MLRLDVPAGDAEIAADLCWSAGASAVEVGRERDGWVTLSTDADLGRVRPEAAASWRLEVRPDDDSWWDGWRPFARAVRVGRLLVRPPWVAAPDDDGSPVIEVVIDAGRSFGTGSHASTLLVLAQLEARLQPGGSVLDVGCGSGTLAIAAALLGAGRVVAVDPDPAALTATIANAEANGVGGAIAVSDQDVVEVAGAFDLVLANLGSPLVVDLAPAIAARVASGGAIVLAGLLDERWLHAIDAYPDFDVVGAPLLDGWRGIVLRRIAGR